VRQTSVLGLALRYGTAVFAVVAVGGSIVGGIIAGVPGVLSVLVGAFLAAAFMGLTAGSILIAERVSRGRPTSGRYFGIIVGTWAIKLVIFAAVAFLVRDLPWMQPYLFFGALVIVVIGSLLADGLALQRARVPYVGDIALPGDKKPENTA
jgi:hypothetical protein